MTRSLYRFFKHYQTLFGTIWLGLLFLLAFSYAMFQGGFVSWFVFYSFLPVLINSLLVLFYPLRDLKITRSVNKRELFGGETLEVSIEIQRRLPFPLLYLVVEDHLPAGLDRLEKKGKKKPSKGLFSLGFNRTSSFTYNIKEMPRGEHTFIAVELKTGDFFGFIQKKRVVPLETRIAVYPKIQLIDSWAPQDLAYGGNHRSKKHFEHDLTSISSIRDYMPGDRLSWIDWKSTARSNHIVTKEFDYPMNRDVVVVFDLFGEARSENQKNFETGLSLAASLVDRTISLGASVGFISIGRSSTFFELMQQSTIKWQILNHLVKVNPNGVGEASHSLIQYLQKLSHQATILYVTTQINKKDIRLFNEIMTRGLTIEFFFVHDGPVEPETLQLLGQLDVKGIQTRMIRSPELNQELKAGGTRATV